MTSFPIQLSATPTISPPPAAKAAGFTSLVRSDTFTNLSGIDTANTGADGFPYYIRVAWPPPTATDAAGQATWAGYAANSGSNFSIVNGSLNIAGTAAASNIAMASACYSATNLRGYAGHFYGGGFYSEVIMSWVGPLGAGSLAYWHQAKSFYLNTAVTNFIELDTMENGDLVGSNNMLTHSGFVTWPTDGSASSFTGANNTGDTGDGVLRTWGLLWKTKAQNGGTGSLQYYQNNVLQTSLTAPDVMDTDAYLIYISGQCVVNRIRIWQAPGTPVD